MPWSKPNIVEFSEKVTPSFLSNNLSADGRGRFAFAHGARVQCTRKHDKKQGRNDFSLAMKADGFEVIETFWWQNVSKFSRPLLVVGTSVSRSTGKTSVQVWDTRNGRGTRVFNLKLGIDGAQSNFARGLGNAVKKGKSNVLFVGLSSGEVHGYEINKKALLERTSILQGLTSATSCVSGDKCSPNSSHICASDERGHVAAWMYNDTGWTCIFKYRYEDRSCALALKGNMLIAGHSSGVVSFHDIIHQQKLAEATMNTRAITCIDVHQTQDIVLVGGEDCRVSVFTLPKQGLEKVRMMLSVCQNGMVIGGRFTCTHPDRADIGLLLAEHNYLIKYEYNGF